MQVLSCAVGLGLKKFRPCSYCAKEPPKRLAKALLRTHIYIGADGALFSIPEKYFILPLLLNYYFKKMYAPDFIAKMKSSLIEERTNLEEQLLVTSAHPLYDTQTEEDVAEKTEADATNQDIIAQLQVELTKVNSALERIERKTYGKCANGNDYISEARLEALPTAENCIEHDR